MIHNLFKIDGIVKQDDPIDIIPKFNIFDFESSIQENITEDIKGSPLNHTEWASDTNKVNLLIQTLKKISSIERYNGTLIDWYMEQFEHRIWSMDDLKKATPNINWDKIFLGLFGRTNVTDKVLVMDTHFTHHINDVIKQIDKRLVNFTKFTKFAKFYYFLFSTERWLTFTH